jgi:hypothetical protein
MQDADKALGLTVRPSLLGRFRDKADSDGCLLKAFFDSDYVLPRPVEVTADGLALEPWRGASLTLGNEIDKLASNIALGRDSAGVHYRSDSIRGLIVGEQQALGLLRDYSRTYNERFDGFIVRKFNGDKIKITAGDAKPH